MYTSNPLKQINIYDQISVKPFVRLDTKMIHWDVCHVDNDLIIPPSIPSSKDSAYQRGSALLFTSYYLQIIMVASLVSGSLAGLFVLNSWSKAPHKVQVLLFKRSQTYLKLAGSPRFTPSENTSVP
jgi:hypothetical protein